MGLTCVDVLSESRTIEEVAQIARRLGRYTKHQQQEGPLASSVTQLVVGVISFDLYIWMM